MFVVRLRTNSTVRCRVRAGPDRRFGASLPYSQTVEVRCGGTIKGRDQGAEAPNPGPPRALLLGRWDGGLKPALRYGA